MFNRPEPRVKTFEGNHMIDTIVVTVIVVIAAVFIGRRFFRQFTSGESTCNCSGCGQAGSCSSIQDSPDKPECNGSR